MVPGTIQEIGNQVLIKRLIKFALLAIFVQKSEKEVLYALLPP